MPRTTHRRLTELALRASALAVAVFVSLGDARAADRSPRDPFLMADASAASSVWIGDNANDLIDPLVSTVSREESIASTARIDNTIVPTHYVQSQGGWGWEIMPDGLIYRSYQAGPRESRLALHQISNSTPLGEETLWDATLGGRRGLLRYGNGDSFRPQGWQLDIEGATIVRLNLDNDRDVDSSDFRFGVPLTYGSGNWQYKTGYYHLSSHLGDEFIARTPGATRINYVRDAIILGASYNPNPCWRLYGETAYAFFTAGGAEPWEFQFGAEYSRPGMTGIYGTPFFATNAHLREETDFSGDWTAQTGWLWRGATGSTMRLGLHYMNGKSTQYQFFNRNEEQIGLGIWYDF
ncbi:hypothetical protein Mal64_19470 [Pseudobythopirellula maris]|uniref:DUF1207 domain-containing protein n=1 Tax=Pseudobythopirellula maris TaxID=2527991 RepID=A0A5C5ZN22_9BACT|nr:DUF1207 domain-containing protein [Pseudobythopirellula maris]TWT88465.1 hypothetical protein Mal64_19470 [Pseudobythopirellula maris]